MDRTWEDWVRRTGELPPDFDAMPSIAELPDPLLLHEDGGTVPVTTPEQWDRQKRALRAQVEHWMEREAGAPPFGTTAAGPGNPEVMIQFGTGTVDFAGLFRILKDAGFAGPVVVEGTAVGATLEETVANARANREFLENVFAQL